jgi:hypothetical protein
MIPYPFFIKNLSQGEWKMAKVSLTIKTGNVKESEIFEIDRITTLQVLKLKTEVGAILKELKANGELTNVLEGLIGGDMKPSDIADMNQKEILEQLESAKDERFITGIAGAFDKLLDTLPERALSILSIMSGIDYDIIVKTDFLDLMDIYDAVMQENDILKIVDRIKKSFFGTKNQWGEMIRTMFNKQK